MDLRSEIEAHLRIFYGQQAAMQRRMAKAKAMRALALFAARECYALEQSARQSAGMALEHAREAARLTGLREK